jgi:hypothetical protein
MKTKIYLVENCYDDPNKVYIGKTINCRKNNHQQTYGKNIIYNYIDEVNSLNYKDWEPLETYWIEQFRQWGFEVLNPNKKGGGGPNKWNDELINSDKNQLRKEKIKNNKERANKISKKTKGIPLSEEHKQKLRVPKPNAKGKKKKEKTELEKIKISDSLKGRNNFWLKGKTLSEDRKHIISKSNSIPVIQYDLNDKIIKEWESQIIASKSLNINPSSITNCLKNRSKTAGGYKWKYKKLKNK